MFDVITQNRESALRAEGGNTITQTGAYTVKILQAEIARTPNGAQFIELYIEDLETSRRQFTRFYMTKTDGTESFGANIFNALLVCANVQKCTPTRGKVWDAKMQVKQGETYVLPEIVNQRVGLLLRRRNRKYLGTDGMEHNTYNMEPVTAFNPQSRLTASEIIKGVTTPRALDQRLAQEIAREDREAREAAPAHAAPAATPASRAAARVASEPMANDDVPF